MQGLPKYILPEKKSNFDSGRFGSRKLQRPGLEKNNWSRGSSGREYLQLVNTTTSSTNSTTSTFKSTPAGSKCKIFCSYTYFIRFNYDFLKVKLNESNSYQNIYSHFINTQKILRQSILTGLRYFVLRRT